MADEAHDHVVSPWLYVTVLLGLMLLLALTLTAAFFDFDRRFGISYASMTIAVLIAIIKAVLIILFFMHVKYASRVTWAFASAAFLWLGIMMTLSLSDYFTRNYPAGTPMSSPEAPSPQEIRPAPRHDAVVPGASAAPLHKPWRPARCQVKRRDGV